MGKRFRTPVLCRSPAATRVSSSVPASSLSPQPRPNSPARAQSPWLPARGHVLFLILWEGRGGGGLGVGKEGAEFRKSPLSLKFGVAQVKAPPRRPPTVPSSGIWPVGIPPRCSWRS